MAPVHTARRCLVVGPRKVLDDPGCAHLAHHLQRALDLPGFYLVGETGVDAHLGVDAVHRLLGTQGYQGRFRHARQQAQQCQYRHAPVAQPLPSRTPQSFTCPPHGGHYTSERLLWQRPSVPRRGQIMTKTDLRFFVQYVRMREEARIYLKQGPGAGAAKKSDVLAPVASAAAPRTGGTMTQTSDFSSSKCERVKWREPTCIKDVGLGQQKIGGLGFVHCTGGIMVSRKRALVIYSIHQQGSEWGIEIAKEVTWLEQRE